MTTNNFFSFTDILDDDIEIPDSQPISPVSNESKFWGTSVINENSTRKTLPENPIRNDNPRNIEEIDPKYRNVFTHANFNAVQTKVIGDALFSDKSMVVCAPTGSGKTVIFEMAIVQLLMEREQKNYTGDFKIIYMAPVKSLCNERLADWHTKFTSLGCQCIEVTGDQDLDFDQLKHYSLIITTPEKWDILTRRWRDHRELVEVIKLFLIDEVHILNDETRGPVLEAVVSRMKTIKSSAEYLYRSKQALLEQGIGTKIGTPPKIRFVAVSATIGNPEDVAAWLGTNDSPAINYKFGDEYRPVKVNRIVEGYHCDNGTSTFKFDIILNYKLCPLIKKYSNRKPTLVFCNTRKGVILTAETLCRTLNIDFSLEQKAKLKLLASKFKNKQLQNLILNGVGCHHAGLLYEERVNIERAFKDRDLPVLITTTTLAMGVNLPAHLVIIKNTKQYVKGAYEDYSISSILQMVGRAGRPQFDTEATAIIMTNMKDKPRYQALVGGSEPLQSFLHKRVPENLNSEIALGTVRDLAQCVEWLQSTFLYVRAAADPRKYLGLPNNASAHHISNKITELCVKAKNGLESAGLIKVDSAGCIESTEAGRFMSLYYMDLETVKHIMKINGTETIEQLLDIICASHELSDMYLRVDEKRILNTLNRSKSTATIRFPIKGKINTREKKLSCIIQAVLGCLPIHEPSLHQESMKIMKIAERVCNCLVAYVTRSDFTSNQPLHFSAVLSSITLAKCITANLWENSVYLTKQLKGIGPTYSSMLAIAGKVKFALLENSHPRDLERIMNKGPPAGNDIQKQISLLPKYQIQIKSLDDNTISLQIILLNYIYLSENTASWTAGYNHKAYIVVGDTNNNLLLFTYFNDRDLIKLHGESMVYLIKRKDIWEHKVMAHCISSNYVGIDVHDAYLFKSLYPECRDASENGNNDKKTTHTQFTIKRSNSDDKIELTKEKKKRNNALIDKVMSLKRPLYSNSIDQTFNSQSTDMTFKNVICNKSFYENNMSENRHINDNDYESLMREEVTKKNVDNIDDDNERKQLQFTKRQITQNDICNYKQKKFRCIKKKNNFAFIDLLEKNMDLDDSEDNSDGIRLLNDKKEEYIFKAIKKKKIGSCKNSDVTQIQQNKQIQIPQATLTFDEMENWENISDKSKFTQSFEKGESANNTYEGRHVNNTKNNEISDIIKNNVAEYLHKTKCDSGTTFENNTVIVASTGQDEIACSSEELYNKVDEIRQKIVNAGNEKNAIVSQNLQQTKANSNRMNNNEILDDENIEKIIRFIEEKSSQKEHDKNIISSQIQQTSQAIAHPNEIEKAKPTNDYDLSHTINCFNRFNESRDVNDYENNKNESWNEEKIEMIIRATEKNIFEKDSYNYITSSQIQQTPQTITFPREIEKVKLTNHSSQKNDCLNQIQNILKSKEIIEEDNNTNFDIIHNLPLIPLKDCECINNSTKCTKSHGIVELDALSHNCIDNTQNDKEREKNNDIKINMCNKSNLDIFSNKKNNDSDQLHPNLIKHEENVSKTLSTQNNEVPNEYSKKEVMVKSNNSSLNMLTDQYSFEKVVIPDFVMKNNTISTNKLKKDVIKEKYGYNNESVQNPPEPCGSRNNSAPYLTNKYEMPKIIPSIFRSYNKRSTSEGRSCDDKIESIIKYSYSNISTRVTHNENVCIIHKTKMDLGVTEITKRINVKKTNEGHINEGRNISIVNMKENGTVDKNTYKNPYPIAKACSQQLQREKIHDNKQRNEVQNLFKPQNINSKKVYDGATVEPIPNCAKEETKINNNVNGKDTTSVLLNTETESKLPKTRIKNVLERSREIFRNNWIAPKGTNSYSSDIQTPPKWSKTSENLNKIEPQIKHKIRDFTQCGPEIKLPTMFRFAEAHRSSNFTNELESFVECKDTEENVVVVNEDSNAGVITIDDSLNSLGSSMDEPMFNQDDELRTVYEIDPAMFNPQTLLRINKDSEDVIPTTPDLPDEFTELNFPTQPQADNFTHVSQMCQCKIPTKGQIQAQIYEERNAFDGSLNSTPSRLIRPRVVIGKESIESIYNTHFQNSAEYRPSQSFHCPAIDAARRQAKLNKFQYVAKSKNKFKL